MCQQFEWVLLVGIFLKLSLQIFFQIMLLFFMMITPKPSGYFKAATGKNGLNGALSGLDI